jgi:hypothetical protein
MTTSIKIELRLEAEREAARIRATKARPPLAVSARPWSGIPVTTLRKPKAAGLHRSVVIFFTRTNVVDGSGRLVEEIVIPVEVDRQPGEDAQMVFDRWQPLVRSVCLAEVAKRITGLAWEYRHGLARARARESQLAEMVRADRAGLIQPGLFDRRATGHRASPEDSGRQESLSTASSLLVAQQLEFVLLLSTGGRE